MADWITSFIESGGYLAILVLMALENLFPPIPSELIMPFAGAVAARGDLQLWLVVLAGSTGSLLGTLPWYWAGRALGRPRLERWVGRHGRWLTISPDDVRRADDWFQRHGVLAVAGGRLVPALRTVISAPAGITGMGLGRFLAWSAIGTVAWTGILTGLGVLLESQHSRVASWLDPVTTGIVAAAVLAWIWRVIRFSPDDHRA